MKDLLSLVNSVHSWSGLLVGWVLFTTNNLLVMTGPKREWAVAGVDLTALVVGVLLGWIARRVGALHSHRVNKPDS